MKRFNPMQTLKTCYTLHRNLPAQLDIAGEVEASDRLSPALCGIDAVSSNSPHGSDTVGTIRIPLYGRINGRNGRIAGWTLIDADCLELATQTTWGIQSTNGAHYVRARKGKCGTWIQPGDLLHRVLLGCVGTSVQVDHINHNTFDNRLINLRVATRSENLCNRKITKGNVTGFKGVIPSPTQGKFIAQIGFRREKVYLGTFADAESAARAYDEAARQLHGEFASLNFSEHGA